MRLITNKGLTPPLTWYDAWGRTKAYSGYGMELAASAIGNRFCWQGREYSWTTGFYYFRARWYDHITGRWLSNDPIGISGGLNQYVFCANNPVNFTDPDGCNVITKGAGKIIKLAVRGIKAIKKGASYDDLVRAGREGEDLLAKNRRIAKEVATDVGNGKPPIHDPAHGPIEEGFRPHYHPYGRPGNHIFYSIAGWLTLSHWAEGHGGFLEGAATVGDWIQPLSILHDITDVVDEFRDDSTSVDDCK